MTVFLLVVVMVLARAFASGISLGRSLQIEQRCSHIRAVPNDYRSEQEFKFGVQVREFWVWGAFVPARESISGGGVLNTFEL